MYYLLFVIAVILYILFAFNTKPCYHHKSWSFIKKCKKTKFLRIWKEKFMEKHHHERSTFSGKLGFVLSAAGASVGLGNIWRFPYLAAKYGGGIFLLIYIILALTFGYSMIVAETALGRMTRKMSGRCFWKNLASLNGCPLDGWINAIIPVLIVPYYSVIGGWVIKYLIEYIKGNSQKLAEDGYFSEFISNGTSTEVCFLIFAFLTVAIIYAGVRNRSRARFQIYDAGSGIFICAYYCLLCYKTRCPCRSEIFPGTKY